MMLQGDTVYLRAIDPEDLDYMYTLENDASLWEMGNTHAPISKYTLREYLENAHRDIYEVKQLRLAICKTSDDELIGVIDLYDFDPYHKRAGVGIAIAAQSDRKRGYGTAALELLIHYAFNHLLLHQLFAGVIEDNIASRTVFEKLRFRESGIRKDWILVKKGFKNEIIYQLINE